MTLSSFCHIVDFMEKEATPQLTVNQQMTEKFKDAEKAFRTVLPAKSYAVIRVDGKGFSKYTKNLEQPFDKKFTRDMRETTKFLCENIDGAILGFTQSDEISIIISDLSGSHTQPWFGGQIQKIVSISAALATAKFNSIRPESQKLALFDGRVHPLNGVEEVLEYLQWRQTDTIKNSVSMLASHHFSHKQLQGVSSLQKKQMLEEVHGVSWKALSPAVKQGSLVKREAREETVSFFHGKEKEQKEIQVVRRSFRISDAPFFDTLESIGVEALLSGIEED